MVLQRDVARHERQMESLTAQASAQQTVSGRIDQRLLNIEGDIAEIKAMLRNGKGPGVNGNPAR